MPEAKIIIPLLAGFFLDSIIGDPRWLPHPVRLFGNVINRFTKVLNKGPYRKNKGILMVVLLVVLTGGISHGIMRVIHPVDWLYFPIASIMVYYGLASHSLIAEALKVNRLLNRKGTNAARKQLSNIVGRDTGQLSPNQIRIAALETLAENLSDGVIAPLFFYAIGGIPLMFAYKMANTMDSIVGYKTEPYRDFGWFAARTDDVLNFLPARITALLMTLVSMSRRGVAFIFRYGRRHSSPNAGYPEAALAGILDCRFGGSNAYFGKMVHKPFIGLKDKTITDRDMIRAGAINAAVSIISILLIWMIRTSVIS